MAATRGSDPGISNDIVAPVRIVLARLGVAPATLAPTGAASASGFISGPLADGLLERAAAELKNPAIGLTLAEQIPIGSLGLLDYALTTSATLGDALQRVADHYALATQRVRMQLVTEAASSRLELERQKGPVHSRHWIEFSLALIATRIRQSLGDVVIFDGADFVHPAPPDVSHYQRLFRAPAAFGQGRDALRFPAELLNRTLLTASKALAEVLDARMRELIPHGGGDDPLLQGVRQAVSEGLDRGDVSIELAIGRLQITRRTLQRELRRRETSHKEIVDDIRKERALILLQSQTKVSEVAFKLGFSEPSAFFKAFRRWTGTSPRASVGKSKPE